MGIQYRQLEAAQGKARKEKRRIKLSEANLSVLCGPSGTSFHFRAQHQGKDRTLRLSGVVTLGDARAKVLELLRQQRDGIDIFEEHQRQIRERAVRQQAEDARLTLAEGIELYCKLHARALKSGRERERILTSYFAPTLGGLALEDITRAQVMRLIDDKKAQGKEIQSLRMFGAMRWFFDFHVARGHLTSNPLAGIRSVSIGREKPRNRVLTRSELRDLWNWLHSDTGEHDFETIAVLKFLTLTGQRLGEALAAEWSHITGDRWDIPVTKNGHAHAITLSPQALTVIDALRARTGALRFVFGGGRGNTPPDKSSVSRALREAFRAGKLSGQPFTPHDLRRTFATISADELGTAPHVVERCLNHVPPRIVRTYNLAKHQGEVRRAMEAWGTYLASLNASNIITFPSHTNSHQVAIK